MSVLDYIRKILPMRNVSADYAESGMAENNTITVIANQTDAGEAVAEEDDLDETGEYKVYEREILPDKIVCPDCGGITLEGFDFCDKCGAELNMYK